MNIKLWNISVALAVSTRLRLTEGEKVIVGLANAWREKIFSFAVDLF